MILSDYYWFFQGALDDATCDKIIERGKERMDEEVTKYGEESIIAQVGGNASVRNIGDGKQSKTVSGAGRTKQQLIADGVDINDTFQRDSYVSFFSDVWIYEIVHNFLHQANDNAGWKYDVDFSEQLQYTEYKSQGESGDGQFYSWHCDGQWGEYKLFNEDNPEHANTAYKRDDNGELILGLGNKPQFVDNTWTHNPEWDGKVRKLSMTVNLTDPDEYSGGEFQIDRGPHYSEDRYYNVEEIKPRGSIIVFPSFVYHQVTPVTKGERKSLVMWTLGPKWR
jgi:hypothetical protein